MDANDGFSPGLQRPYDTSRFFRFICTSTVRCTGVFYRHESADPSLIMSRILYFFYVSFKDLKRSNKVSKREAYRYLCYLLCNSLC